MKTRLLSLLLTLLLAVVVGGIWWVVGALPQWASVTLAVISGAIFFVGIYHVIYAELEYDKYRKDQ